MDPTTLVIIPTYNEAENIDPLLEMTLALPQNLEVLFVDDGSADATRQKIASWQARHPGRVHLLPRATKLGLGSAYVAGFKWGLAGHYSFFVQMDADLSHDPRMLPRFISLSEEYDGVLGSRYIEGGGADNWTFYRRWVSRIGSLYARTILGVSVQDLTGGFNGWRRKVIASIALDAIQSNGYAFQIELKYRALKKSFLLKETPILFIDRREGKSKMSLGIVIEAIFRVFTIRFL